MTDKPATTAIPELALARTLIAAERIPVGSIGTVVHVYGDGTAYEIEFTFGDTFEEHRHSVRTYSASEVEAVQ